MLINKIKRIIGGKSLLLAISLLGLSMPLAVAAQTAQTSRCVVRDSTGTPLNVRSTPGGRKIVGKLKNGARVYVRYYSGDAKDQSWAEVLLSTKKNAKPLGWVLQDFLECED